MAAFVLAAAEGAAEESSPVLFYAAGLLLAGFAVLISAAGLTRLHLGERGARTIMALSALLVVLTMAAAALSGG